MSVRRLIAEVDLKGLNVTEFCREHGISTWFFYQLRKRYAVEGEAGLEPRSRAPKAAANRTPEWVEDVIVDLRKELDDAGLDAGAATIWSHLRDRLGADVALPSEATIWRVLTRRGFIVPQPHKAPQHAYRTFQADWANECWQLDDIDWELEDGSPVKIITLIDDCTRLCPGLKAAPSANGEAAFEAMTAAATRWGWPQRFLSDNAKAYKHTLAAAVGALGVITVTAAATTPRPKAKWNGSTRPSKNGSEPNPSPPPSTSSKPNSTPSSTSTTTSGPTGPSAANHEGCPATTHSGFRGPQPWVADGGMRSLEPSVPNRLLSAKELLTPARVGVFTKVLLMY